MSGSWDPFEAPFRVRFDESGPDGLVRTSTLLRYAQDIAWQHSDARGYDREWYRERGLTWVVRAVAIEVAGPIPMGTTLQATTSVVGHRRVWSRRRGDFRLPAEPVVAGSPPAATVITDWLLLDRANRPARIPPEFEAAFELLPATNGLIRVALESAPEDAVHSRLAVRPHELDPLVHANNAVYLDWLEESVLAAEATAVAPTQAGPPPGLTRRIPRRYRMEYAGSAEPEVNLESALWPVDGGWAYRLAAPGGADLVRARVDGG